MQVRIFFHYQVYSFVRDGCIMTYILGLDVGSKTIGVAKISVENEITTPVLTLKRQSVKKM